MNICESWNLALESISSVPFTFGFVPTDSVVVLSLDVEGKMLAIGATGRIDLEALYAARDSGEFGVMSEVTVPIASAGRSGGIVAVWSEVEGDEEGSELLDFVSGIMSEQWPFEDHWGTFLVTPDSVLGMRADGQFLGRKDALELTLTRYAMAQNARDVPVGSTSLRVERLPDGEGADEVESGRQEVLGGRLTGALVRSLTREISAAVERGHESDPRVLGRLGAALDDVRFRDAVMSWAVMGTPAVKSMLSVPVELWLTEAERFAPPSEVKRVIHILRSIAARQPAGTAAQPLAAASFLSWYCGLGAVPRELMEQALEEDPENSLAHIVSGALSVLMPPPWVRFRQAIAQGLASEEVA